MRQNVLEIKHYSKVYSGNTKAVNDISLNVKSGEIRGFWHNGGSLAP